MKSESSPWEAIHCTESRKTSRGAASKSGWPWQLIVPPNESLRHRVRFCPAAITSRFRLARYSAESPRNTISQIAGGHHCDVKTHGNRADSTVDGQRASNSCHHASDLQEDFTPDQQQWLHRIEAHLAENLSIDKDDFDVTPSLEGAGGWGKANRDFEVAFRELQVIKLTTRQA